VSRLRNPMRPAQTAFAALSKTFVDVNQKINNYQIEYFSQIAIKQSIIN
jgi:hypothetical protein